MGPLHLAVFCLKNCCKQSVVYLNRLFNILQQIGVFLYTWFSSPVWVKPKSINLVFVAFTLSTQH